MIADRIRSIQAVSGGGGGGFDPSQLSGLKLWLKADTGVTVDGSGNVSSWADQSGNNNTAYQTDPTKYPVFSAAYSVNGVPAVVGQNDQFLQLTQGIGGRYDSTPFTLIWVGTKTNTTTGTTVLEAYTSNGGFKFESAATGFQVNIPNVGSAFYGPSNGLTNPAAHYARLSYPDFKVEATQGSVISRTIGSLGFVSIQRLFVGPTYNLTNPGYAINEVMLLDRSISDAELADIKDYIKTRYNLYTKDSLLLNMQGTAGSTTFVDESPNALTVTPFGDVELVADATFGTVASFDDTQSYLTAPSSSAWAFGTGDFTIEFWIYITSNQNSQGIVGNRPNSSSATTWQILFWTTNNRVEFHSGAAVLLQSTATVPLNTFSHVAFCRSSGTLRAYLNGVQVGSVANSSNLSTSSALYINRDLNAYASNNGINGRIGPLRITKGVARYTANFTPPTGLFPTS